jgi:hypothetical protein
MKEVLTTAFWKNVRKTFYDALEDRSPAETSSQKPETDTPNTSAPPTKPAPSKETNGQ